MMNFIALAIVCSISLIFNSKASSATHPLTGSSIINQPDAGFVFTQMGFMLETIPPNWTYNKTIDSASKIIELGVNNKTLLSFRLENVSPKIHLETYVRQYLRDYNQYGFEITGLQSQNNFNSTTAIVDLKQKNLTTKSRQYFFHKQDKIIIATCADTVANFTNTATTCNEILNSFKWR